MDRLVDRLVTGDQTSDLMSMALMLYSLPRVADQAEALVVMPGLGEDWRIRDAVHTWNMSSAAEHLFVAGIYDGEKTKVQPTIEYLQQSFGMVRTDNVHIQEHAHHTKEQADWIVEQVSARRVTSMALFVSPYHLLRAYSTVLKAFQRHDVQSPQIIPMPVVVAPATPIPEIGESAWTMIHGEVERILKYQQLGDVATPAELQEYINWLWQQPLLKSAA